MRNHVQDIRVCAGEGRYAVTMEAAVTAGEGISCFVYGGELAHVGGQALAAPGPVLHGQQLSRADVWDATVPGHKDAEAARTIARRLAIALGEPVSVSCGIHIDDATREELALLQGNIDAAAELLVERVRQAEGDARLRGAPEADRDSVEPPSASDEDQLVLVDLLDRPVGTMGKLRCHQEGRLHRAFSLLLYRWRATAGFVTPGEAPANAWPAQCYSSPTEKSNISSRLEVLIQRRALTKYHSGGLWANSVCSHPRANAEPGCETASSTEVESLPRGSSTLEAGASSKTRSLPRTSSAAAEGSSADAEGFSGLHLCEEELAAAVPRRLEQELGVPHDAAQALSYQEVGSFVYRHEFGNGLIEFEYDHVFVAPYDGPLDPDPEEVSEVKWVDAEALLADLERHPERYACWFLTVAPMAIGWLGKTGE